MNKKIWMIYFSIFSILVAISLSPLVIPEGIDTPYVMGMPRTLWAGILVSFLIALLTSVAALSITTKES